MRFTRTTTAALLARLLAMAVAVPIAAQGTSGEMIFDGLEKAHGRTFNADMMAMVDMEDSEAIPSGWFMLTTMMLEFDSGDSVSTGFEQSNEQTAADALAENVSLKNVDLDLECNAVQAVEEAGGMMTNVAVATAHDGQ